MLKEIITTEDSGVKLSGSGSIHNQVKGYLYKIMPMKKVSYIESFIENGEFFFEINGMNLKSFLFPLR